MTNYIHISNDLATNYLYSLNSRFFSFADLMIGKLFNSTQNSDCFKLH